MDIEDEKSKKSLKKKSRFKIVMLILLILIVIGVIYYGYRSISIKKEMERVEMAQTTTEEFIQEIRNTGKITDTLYNKLVDELNSTGYAYELELKINLSSKQSLKQEEGAIIENQLYDIYTNKIIEELNRNGVYYLEQGNIITASLKSPKGELNGEHSAIVMVNGNK